MNSRPLALAFCAAWLAVVAPGSGFAAPLELGLSDTIADTLYAAPETEEAIGKAASAAIQRKRDRIEVLAAALRRGEPCRAELTAAEEDLISALSALDPQYRLQMVLRRASAEDGAVAAAVGGEAVAGGIGGYRQAEEAERRAEAEARRQAEARDEAQQRYVEQSERGARPSAPASAPSPQSAAPGRFGGLAGGSHFGAPRPKRAAPPPQVAALPSFPWPPPTPSERLNLTPTQILPASTRNPSLAYVGDRIVSALEAAGYSEYSFYAVPSGFAVVARLERMEADGTPAPQTLRFLAPDAAEPFNFATYVSRLFFAPEGYYRQIVFVVTTQMVRPAGPAPDAKAAEALLQGGADRLPLSFRQIPFTADDAVSALIYEYRKGPQARDVQTLRPGRLDARTNLVRAGLYARLTAGGN